MNFLAALNSLFSFEFYSRSLRVIIPEHAKIHDGKGYTVAKNYYGLAAGASAYFLLAPPAFNYPHLRQLLLSATAAPVELRFFESPTTSANGAAITPRNNNRNSSNVAALAVYSGPTVSIEGTGLDEKLISGSKQTGGFGEFVETEWNLKPTLLYLLKVTNTGTGPTDFNLTLFFYE